MSAIAMSISVPREAREVAWARFALVGFGTVVTAVAANVLVYILGGALVDYDPRFLPLATVRGTILFTLVPAIGAALLYAVLWRSTENSASILAMTAGVVFAVALIPVVTYVPSVPGANVGQTTVLIVMHVVAANVIVGMLTACAPRPEAIATACLMDQRRR